MNEVDAKQYIEKVIDAEKTYKELKHKLQEICDAIFVSRGFCNSDTPAIDDFDINGKKQCFEINLSVYEHGGYYHYDEDVPFSWLWDENWEDRFKEREEERKRLNELEEKLRREEKEKKEKDKRHELFMKLKEEFL